MSIMEKINVAELLKYCPKGMELDCILFNNPVRYDGLDNDYNYPIIILTENDDCLFLTTEGYLYNMPNSKCVIFPKGKTTWEGFVPPCKFKEGDIISDSLGTCIFKGEGIIQGTVDYYCGISSGDFNVKDNECRPNGHYGYIVDYRLATEEEKQKLFQAIKDNGYKWNTETKSLEKLVEPKFKVGDRIKHKRNNSLGTVALIDESFYHCAFSVIPICEQDEYELVLSKFDITTLTSFESKVLVRAADNQFWRPAIWGVKQEGWDFCCVVGGEMWEQCIPYEGNEHLLGNTDDCDEYYKTW